MPARTKTAPAIVTRPLEVEDLPRVQEIDHLSAGRFRAYTFAGPMRSYLGGDLSLSHVAEIDGRVVGFIFAWGAIGLHWRDDGARVEMIGVDPAYRRRGVGRLLLAAFVDSCRRMRIGTMHMLVRAGDRELKAFLTKHRFQASDLVDYELSLT